MATIRCSHALTGFYAVIEDLGAIARKLHISHILEHMALRTAQIVVFLALTACQPHPTGTAITNVTVIDAINGVRENQTIIFENDRIVAVQPSDMATDVGEVIDGSNKYLIPGLWDFHVHFSFDDRLTDDMPALFLSYGVTSVRDTGGLIEDLLPVVEKLRAPNAIGPRVFFAGPLLDGSDVVYDGGAAPALGIRNATPGDARAMIELLADQGIDFIKIYEMVSPEVFAAMVETANELGLPIASHVPLSLRASEVGTQLDALEHLRNVEMDCANNAAELHAVRLELLENPENLSGAALRSSLHSLQRMPAIAAHDDQACEQTMDALQSTTQVPTLRLIAMDQLPPWQRADWEDALARIPGEVREDWIAAAALRAANVSSEGTDFANWVLQMIGQMHARDIPIAAGTDTPIFISVPGYSLHAELEHLVRAGLTPMEALESATVRPAEFFSLEDEMGTIGPGMKADLVLLDANPLDQITNTRAIVGVVTKGNYFDIETLRSQTTLNR